MPRCTRCNAPLDNASGGDTTPGGPFAADATSHDSAGTPPGEDATSSDLFSRPLSDDATISGPFGNPLGQDAIRNLPGPPAEDATARDFGTPPSEDAPSRDPFGNPLGDDTATRDFSGPGNTLSAGPGGSLNLGPGNTLSAGPGGTLDAGPGNDPNAPGRRGGLGRHSAGPGGIPASGGPGGGAESPPPPPWSPPPQDPVPWTPPPRESPPWGSPPPQYTSPMPPSGETSIPLSPEPWAEPAIWQPPPPAKKSKQPYFLILAGVVLLAGVALGIVFWPSGSKPAPPAGNAASQQSQQGVAPENEAVSGSPSGDGDLAAQAGTVDGLLKEMAGTRSDLGSVVTAGCGTPGLQRIRDQRQEQLDRARALKVDALQDGEPLKDALVRALEASVKSNQRYLDVAPGCPSDDDVAPINQEASDAKNEFIRYWTPIAEKAGLPPRDADTI
ncbi:hypothetical protein [Actinomadura rubrisoli]|uniref:Uncharacterized protein n=1 Tax=Actinomadura rubrisoli TaxID=2530368 RepID=A0A4V2YQV4_9ACTN|nr:hypothetical protein [Actinomadura rubrisoli]TDD63687.1 hypothetical protein E1298_43395 [Actinomadura rubrisoli]